MNILLWALLVAIAASAAFAGFSAAPWLPTKPKQRRHLTTVVPLVDSYTYYDLGAGDGSVLFELARAHPNIRAIGYEISVLPYLVSLMRKAFGGHAYRNVSLRFGNLYTQNLADADVVFVFLLEKAYPKLITKFAAELKDDTLVYVEAWPLPHVAHEERKKEEHLLPLYIYRGSAFRL